MTMTTPPDTDLLKRHLAAAANAAAAGDQKTYIIELAASHVLDGIARRLARAWPVAEPGFVEVVVAEAAEAFFTKAAGGGIRSAAGFIYKTGWNRLSNLHRDGALRAVPLDKAEDIAVDPDQDDEFDRERLRTRAVQLARQLIGSLGGTTIISVMTYIIDAADAGETDIDNKTIADALGLELQTVRRSKSRGFQRLAKAARKHGIEVPNELLPADEDDQDEEG
jgi:DNA-directed RNA polymerase specialized sigma24 family protein